VTWIPVAERMPPRSVEDSFGCIERTIPVLATDGKYIMVAYHQVYTDGDAWPKWVEQGRDGYDFENVTHWMKLPDLPSFSS
jgi:hypothetical protein